MRHLVFSRVEAERLIAERYSDRELSAFRSCAVPAMQADYFRYAAVLALGGMYSDADFHCRRPLRGLIDSVRGGLLFMRESRGNLVNGIFAFDRPGHPLLRLALDVATENVNRRASNKVNMATGPWIFSSLRGLHEVGSLEKAREMAVGQPLEPLVCSATDAIGSFDRLAEAFEDVRIEGLGMATHWIAEPQSPPTYKESDNHWINWQRNGATIFS